jgi:hypothetical protein
MIQRPTRLHALQRQVYRLEKRVERLRATSESYFTLRLALFTVAALLSGTVFFLVGAWQWAVATLPLFAPFVVAVYAHRQVEAGLARHEIWLRLKATHLARMELEWERIPATLPLVPRPDHPFVLDLDLVGERSLHQLLDTAVSQGGSRRLFDWLTATAVESAEIAERQARVKELLRTPLFRDKLSVQTAMVAGSSAGKWPGQQILDWLRSHPAIPSLRRTLGLLALLAVVNATVGLLYLLELAPAWWLGSWFLYAAVFLSRMNKTASLFHASLALADHLEKLEAVFHYLETYRYHDKKQVQSLCAPFRDPHNRPSSHLKQLRRVVAGAGLQQQPLLGLLLNAFFPWNYYFAYRLEQCKRDLTTLLPVWLNAWYELEALSSLATFAYLNPGYAFPEIGDGSLPSKALCEGRQLGHPLIPAGQRVGNDFTIDALGRIVIITGSNMAGKSSFLRALGVNLCLAYAGGPVVAQEMRTLLFRLFTSMRVTDSVTEGFSFFYAEVRRLKALLTELERVEERPLFFLIDEIFRGTNNQERLLGSRAYVRALAGGHGAGFIATHDLELVKLAGENPLIHNYHFRDAVVDGHMVFDYKLHPGPCPTTNALKIMALAGLPVENGAD